MTAADDYGREGSYLADAGSAGKDLRAAAVAEIDQLRRWKREALAVHAGWDQVFDAVHRAAGEPVSWLGCSRSQCVLQWMQQYLDHEEGLVVAAAAAMADAPNAMTAARELHARGFLRSPA